MTFPDWQSLRTHATRAELPCPRCHDFGILEDSFGNEDVCPTCEGGIWRERETWRALLTRTRLPFGLRLSFYGRRPKLYKDFKP